MYQPLSTITNHQRQGLLAVDARKNHLFAKPLAQLTENVESTSLES